MANYDWYRERVADELLSLVVSIKDGDYLSDKEIKKLIKANKKNIPTTLAISVNPTKSRFSKEK